jgi:hypothetical protein
MQSTAKTPQAYVESLPKDRRAAIEAVRAVMRKNLPKGYAETMQYGMISYVVPLSLYPQGYLGKKDVPLPYAALASQKNHMAVYLMNIYAAPNNPVRKRLVSAYKARGTKMDAGKSCIRFTKLEDLPLDAIGKAIASTSVKAFISVYENSRKKK